MTCGQQGCLENTRWPNKHECWRSGKCPKHYWGDSTWRYQKKRFRSDERNLL